MFAEGDDDEDESLGAVRYPVMPSTAGLQQMRNRLHLALLGKKLMKWTAMATGKHLRRLAIDMSTTFQTYAEDMRAAFLLVARSRYFIPHLNYMVRENLARDASVTIVTTSKSKGGVKVVKLKCRESGQEPYPYLAIGLGGMTVHDTKVAWLKLLKLMIKILQQRVTFQQVEIVHKNATKQLNKISREIIPRTICTLLYILSELEIAELKREREEFLRSKRVKEKKIIRLELNEVLKEIMLVSLNEYNNKPPIRVSEAIPLTNVSMLSISGLTASSLPISCSILPKLEEHHEVRRLPYMPQGKEILNKIEQIQKIAVLSQDYDKKLEENGQTKLILPHDDELLPLQDDRVAATEKVEQILDNDIALSRKAEQPLLLQKVPLEGQEQVPENYQQTQKDDDPPKESKSSSENQQSPPKQTEESSPKENATSSQGQQLTTQNNQQLTGEDNKVQQLSQSLIPAIQQIRNLLEQSQNDSVKQMYIDETDQQLPKHPIPQHSKKQQPLKIESFSSEVPSKVPSKLASIVRRILKLLPNTSKKRDLIVIKQSQESENYKDDFIPPMGYALNSQITKIEELSSQPELSAVEENNRKIKRRGKNLETGNMIELLDPDSEIEFGYPASVSTLVCEKTTDSEFPSPRCLSINQCSERQIDDSIMSDITDVQGTFSNHFVNALKQLKPNQEQSSNYNINKKTVSEDIDEIFKSADDLDVVVKQRVLDIIKKQEKQLEEINSSKMSSVMSTRKIYENILGKSLEESDVKDAFHNPRGTKRTTKAKDHKTNSETNDREERPLKIYDSDEILRKKRDSDSNK